MNPNTESTNGAAGMRANMLWTLPNALTLLRIILVPFLVAILLTRYA